ncbi:MAG: hypothetical protein K0U78_02600 [Actinomycetia bacterium]|nr:hypothetical protein [Actinomycetes bacterium]
MAASRIVDVSRAMPPRVIQESVAPRKPVIGHRQVVVGTIERRVASPLLRSTKNRGQVARNGLVASSAARLHVWGFAPPPCK